MTGRNTRVPLLRCLAVSVAFLTAGCGPLFWRGNPQVATATVEVPVAEALILPEPGAAPQVLTVLETDYINAVAQEIILATHSRAQGQNAIYAVFFGPVKGRTGWENLRKDEFLNEEALGEEMEERLPGVPMHVSNYFVQNRYGPFNYAIGNAGGGELCIYAWQRIQSQVRLSLIPPDSGVLAIRLRLCQIGASEQDLLRVMYRYSINGYFLPPFWQPYGKPVGEPEGIGQVGGPLAYPSGLQGDGTVLDGWAGPEPRQAAPVARAPRSTRRYGSAVPQPEPVYQPVQPGYVDPTQMGNLVDPVEGYPPVPGPAVSGQLAPGTRPNVTPGQVQPGAVIDRAPARPVQSEGQSSPFSTPPSLPGVTPPGTSNYAPAAPSSGVSSSGVSSSGSGATGTASAVGEPVRLVPGASSYPTPGQ